MAFLCPSRLGRNKQKRGYYSMMRKLTKGGGFDTITLEDLVKLSWTTPDSRRIILQNFTSCEPQEVTVKQGHKVNYIYREGDWAYVVTDDKKEGFVPFTFLAKIGLPSKPAPRIIDTGTYTKKASDLNPRNFSVESEETDHSGSDLADDTFTSAAWSSDSGSVVTIQEQPSVNYLQTEPFDKLPMFYEVFLDERTNILHKNPLPLSGRCDERETIDQSNDIRKPSYSLQFKVMYNFAGKDAYDVPVRAGATVHLLDDTDPGWFWVRTCDGTEGYVPSNYITEIFEPSTEYVDKNDEEMMGSRHENIKPCDHHFKNVKSNKNEIPTNWKVTNDLKGKNPTNPAIDSSELGNNTKKQRPKKPPRKKKASLDDLSPRLDESIDSIDTCITDSSTDYLDYQTKSSCDGFTPRSNDFSDCSVFDSSFNGVYNYRQCVNKFSDTELSPRSLDVQIHDDNDTSSDMEPNFTQTKRYHSDRDERKDSTNDREVICDTKFKSPKYQSDEKIKDNRNSHQYEAEIKNGDTVESLSVHQHENHKTDYFGRQVSCEIGNSFESKSSYGQKHKRPVSMPAFKSYQEYKKDYFDEYFYDDNDTKFSNRSKHDVVNVAEILKMRKTNEHRKHSHSNEKHRAHTKQNLDDHDYGIRKMSSAVERTQKEQGVNQPKENRNTHNTPKLKQFLLNLPTTNIENQTVNMEHESSKIIRANMNDEHSSRETKQQARKRYSSTSDMQKKYNETKGGYEFKTEATKSNTDDKNAFHQRHGDMKAIKTRVRQYNSSTDLRQIDATNLNGKEGHYEVNNQYSKMSQNKEHLNKQKKNHLRPYNSSTDLREIGGKPDWSFGYPRRTRQSIGRKEIEVPDSENPNGRKRSATGNSNRKSKHEYETEKRIQDVYNFKVRPKTGNNVRQTVIVCTTDNSNRRSEACNKIRKGEENRTDISCDDGAMMALLSQTDNLLQKTDKLLHRDDGFRKQEISKLQDQNISHKINWSDKNDKVRDTSIHNSMVDGTFVSHKARVDTNAAEKCYQFLNNSTIGIHGMTYFVTEENQINGDNISTDTLQEKRVDCKLNSGKTESNDSRKEKSSVMKDNSSKMVSAGLKSLDLKDIRGITEFVCQCACETDTDDMLPIKHGEILHIGLDGQDNVEYYWAFSPRLRKYGFVSKQHVKIPLVTII